MSSDAGDTIANEAHQNTKRILMYFLRQMGLFGRRVSSKPLDVLSKTANSVKKAHKEHEKNVMAKKQYKIDMMRNRIEGIRNKSELKQLKAMDNNDARLMNMSEKMQLKADRLAIKNDYQEKMLDNRRATLTSEQEIPAQAKEKAAQPGLRASQALLAELVGQEDFDRNGLVNLGEKETLQLVGELIELNNESVDLNVPDKDVHGCIMGICSIVGIDAKETAENKDSIKMSKLDFDKLSDAVDYIRREIDKYYGDVEMDRSDDAVTVADDNGQKDIPTSTREEKNATTENKETVPIRDGQDHEPVHEDIQVKAKTEEQTQWKDDLRARVADAAEHSYSEGDFEERLKERGVVLAKAKDGENLYKFKNMENRAMRGDKLGDGLDKNSLAKKHAGKFNLESHTKNLVAAARALDNERKDNMHIHTPEVR